MQIWWLLSPLFVIVVSSCTTGFYSNKPTHCTNKERGVNSFLWTIHRHPPSYLFGTIHVPYTRVWDWIPENSKTAFVNSDSAVFELDLTDPTTSTALADCQLLPRDDTLSDILPPELYARLERHLEYVRTSRHFWTRNDPSRKRVFSDYLFTAITGNWRRKRPVWVLLMINSLDEADVRSRGVPVLDLYLAQLSQSGGKVTGAVERVEEQCGPLNQLNISQVIFALDQTLSQHESLREQGMSPPCRSEALIHHYNCGDLCSFIFNRDTTQVPVLVNSFLSWQELEKSQKLEQYFQDELVDKRNARMADRVAGLLQQHHGTSFFFAFGAGHFLGNDSVIDRLRRAGFRVEHTDPWENITKINKSMARYHRKPRKFVPSDDFLQSADVLYGDIRYQFSKRVPQPQRHRQAKLRLLQTRERQEHLDVLWDRMDPRILNHEKWGHIKTRKGFDGQNIFNDLWMHTGQIRSDNLHQMGKPAFMHGRSTGKTHSENNPSANFSPWTRTYSSSVLQALTCLLVYFILEL